MELVQNATVLSAAMWRNPRPGAIGFGAGVPDPAVHPTALLASTLQGIVTSHAPDILGYAYESGNLTLREALSARHARRDSAQVGADQILLTNGSSGAIDHVAKALIQPGDVVIVEPLSYGAAIALFRRLGADVVTTPMDSCGLDPQGLADTVASLGGKRIQALYCMPSCQNPTGTVLDLERRHAIARLAQTHGFFILQDDTYGEILFGDAARPTFLSLAPEHAVHLGSFSKTIAPGLRTGWIAGPPSVIAKVSAVRTDLGNSPILQRAIASLFEGGWYDAHVRAVSSHYHRKRDRLIAALERECAGLCSWPEPDGGFFLWCRMAGGDPDIFMAAAHEEGVVFLPGGFFEVQPTDYAGYFRLAYAPAPEDMIDEGAIRLGRALRASDKHSSVIA